MPQRHEKSKSELVGSEVRPKSNETLSLETSRRQHRAHMFHQQKATYFTDAATYFSLGSDIGTEALKHCTLPRPAYQSLGWFILF